MKKMIQFEIFFDDLTKTAQHYFCKAFNSTLEEEEQSIIPLAIIDKETNIKEEAELPKKD